MRRPGPVSYTHLRKRRGYSVLHKQLPPSGRIYIWYFWSPGYPGPASDSLYFRNCVPCIPGREAAWLESCCNPCPQDCRELWASILYIVTHIFSVQGTWLYRGRAFWVSGLRCQSRGLQPYHRLLPSCPELEWRQEPGIQEPPALRCTEFQMCIRDRN